MPSLKIPDTDPAAQEALKQFLAAEAAKSFPKPDRPKFEKNTPQREKPRTVQELVSMALDRGLQVVEGGNHMKVLDPSGHLLTEIPRHKGNIATGTARSIVDIILQRGQH